MVDLTGLRSLLPSLAMTPTILYFHENQFVYPQRYVANDLTDVRLASIYSALAADRLAFNSAFNRDTFLDGVDRFLRKLPDKLARPVLEQLKPKCSVLPVPLATQPGSQPVSCAIRTKPLEIVWNHRWEHDKGPERLLAFTEALLSSGLDFRLHVVGQQFRTRPPEFARLKSLLEQSNAGANLGHWGYIAELPMYRDLLHGCDVVLSTALHDFQGLAVLEAVQHGCLPLVPCRLVYPEWFGVQFCYQEELSSVQQEAENAVAKLQTFIKRQAKPPVVKHLEAEHLAPIYANFLRTAIARAG